MLKQHAEPERSVNVFISYDSHDEELLKELEYHLSILKRSGIIIWHDRMILPGENREQRIDTYLNKAHLILPLISPNFMDSDNCHKQTQTALERHNAETARIIPIILRETLWQDSPLGQFQHLPRGDKPITKWEDKDEALKDVIQGIREVVEELQATWQNDLEDKAKLRENNQLDTIQEESAQEERSQEESAQEESREVANIPLRADGRYIIGVDIGRSHLAILLADRDTADLVEQWSSSFDTSDGAEACLTRVADELRAMVKRKGVTWEQVVGIGLATPGPLDRDLQRVNSPSQTERSASLMPGWEGTNIPTYLKHQLKVKRKEEIPIILDNDANMGALGVSRYGTGASHKNLVYIKIGRGIGAGFIINKQLYRGSTNAAGEFGHSVVVNKEKAIRCICGQSGCLETVATELAIVKDARTRGMNIVDVEGVIREANKGNEASKAALESAAEWIGIALGTLINQFNPSLILLDGSVVREYHKFVNSIRWSARNTSLQANWTGVSIEACHLDFPVARGAVANVIKHISGKRQRKPKPHSPE